MAEAHVKRALAVTKSSEAKVDLETLHGVAAADCMSSVATASVHATIRRLCGYVEEQPPNSPLGDLVLMATASTIGLIVRKCLADATLQDWVDALCYEPAEGVQADFRRLFHLCLMSLESRVRGGAVDVWEAMIAPRISRAFAATVTSCSEIFPIPGLDGEEHVPSAATTAARVPTGDGSFTTAATVAQGDALTWPAAEAGVLALRSIVITTHAYIGHGLVPPQSWMAPFAAFLARVMTVVLPFTFSAPSQYVREAAVHLLQAVVTVLQPARAFIDIDAFIPPVVAMAKQSMSDCHPAVRFTGLFCARALLQAPQVFAIEMLLPQLLPPLCLARYYGPERQRYFAHNVWRVLLQCAAPVVGIPADTALTVHSHTPQEILSSVHRSDAHGVHGAPSGSSATSSAASADRSRAASPMRARSLAAALTESMTGGTQSTGSAARMPMPMSASLMPSPASAGGGGGGSEAASVASSAIFPAGGVVTSTAGPLLLARYMSEVVEFYLQQAAAGEYMSGEAGFNCLAELALKADPAVLLPHLPAIMEAAAVGCTSTHWQVRDAAAVCSGRYTAMLPEGVEGILPRLQSAWIALLCDEHAVVRDHAALVVAAGSGRFPLVMRECLAALAAASTRYLAHLTDAEGGGVGGGGRDPTAELAVCGLIYIVREAITTLPVEARSALELVLEVANRRQCAPLIQETLGRELPAILKVLGKQGTKQLFDKIFPILFRCISSPDPSQRSRTWAAGDCIAFLRKLMGTSIFQGRLTPEEIAVIAASDAVPKPV